MEAGTLISGRYRLIRRLGVGGMGEVWAARNERTDRDFAIKLLLPSLARNQEALERFVREAKATGRLRDPGIVDVFDAGQTRDGRPYLVMELLSGESLEARLAREGRLDPFVACTGLARIARSLHRAHQTGIVHRDLSSANIFFATSGDRSIEVPKILDFGVSKIVGPEYDGRVRTGNGAVLGSPAYMSPEQAQGAEKVDCRADVWSLGVLLYECLCGQPPFIARNYNALMMQIVGRPHRSLADSMPELEPEVAALVDACLIKDRAARVQTALELAERLEAVALVLAASLGRNRNAARRAARSSVPPAELPPRMLPPGARLLHSTRRRLTPRLVIALGSALGGTAVGLALGAMVLGASTEPSPPVHPDVAARQAPQVVAPSTAPLVTPVSADPAAENPAEPETDLVRATARGLGIQLHGRRERLKRRAHAPEEARGATAPPPQAQPVAALGLLRKNPY